MIVPPLWQLIVYQLDDDQDAFTPKALAPLLQIEPHSMRDYCREIWPDWEGHYRLTWKEAVVLIYIAAPRARLVKASELYKGMVQNGIIHVTFPLNYAVIDRALAVVKAHREERARRRQSKPTHHELAA